MPDDFVAQAIRDDALRPTTGTLWCERFTPGGDVIEVEGLGAVTVKATSAAGIVTVQHQDAVVEDSRAVMYIVRALGKPPRKWEQRFFGRERDWRQGSWEDQKIRRGTVLACRAGVGIGQGVYSKFIQVRYDEIAAIGRPLDEQATPAMLPAPGWIMIEGRPAPARYGSLILPDNGAADRIHDKDAMWGRVVALPRNLEQESDVKIGDLVAVPWHRGAGATEYVQLEGNIRLVPLDDVWCVAE